MQFPSSWSKCPSDLTKSRQQRGKSCRSLPASCFKHLPAPGGNKKMEQPSQESRGMEYSKRWWGRKGQCIPRGDFQFFSSNATEDYLQSEFYLYVDTHIYTHRADQTSVSTLNLQGERTFIKVAGTSACLLCFVVKVTELSNQMNSGD